MHDAPDGPDLSAAREPAAAPVRRRNRHGRSGRGPSLLPRPGQRDPRASRSDRFDRIVLGVVDELDTRWRTRLGELGEVEYAVEDLPLLPPEWTTEAPLASLAPAGEGHPPRIVLFRRPLERRALDRTDLELLVRRAVAEQLAELLGVAPEDVDPDYDGD